jgi:hypothetical protein
MNEDKNVSEGESVSEEESVQPPAPAPEPEATESPFQLPPLDVALRDDGSRRYGSER